MERHSVRVLFHLACLYLMILGISMPGVGQTEGARKGGQVPSSSALECTVWARKVRLSVGAQVIRKGEPAIIHIELANPTPSPICLTGMTVYLSRSTGARRLPITPDPEYYAPVDVEKRSALEPKLTPFPTDEMFPKGHLAIAAGQSIEFEVDVTSLRWAKMIWSGLSLVPFFDVVENGRFYEYLSLSTAETGSSGALESTRMAVEVQQ